MLQILLLNLPITKEKITQLMEKNYVKLIQMQICLAN